MEHVLLKAATADDRNRCRRIGKMSHRSRAAKARQHVHCDSCFSRRCRARGEGCAVAPCRLLCGALYHLCKEEDHLLLCPNVRVPCLNADYGCPVQLPRSSQAAHLQVCPASVVCCSMEWNRWPVTDAHCYPDAEFHQKLLREKKAGEGLDLAMALRDQESLFRSIKMRKLFPELIQSEEEEEEEREEERRRRRQQKEAALEKELAAKKARAGTWESFSMFNLHARDGKEDEDEDEDEDEVIPEVEDERELTQEEREALARAAISDANLLENYSAYERMFTMEMGGCREAGEAAVGGRGQTAAKGKERGEEEAAGGCEGAAASNTCKPASSTSTCHSATQRKGKFVYSSLEPMKIITVCTFKVPTSFAAKQSRIRNPGFYKRESRAVDTSDLGVALEEMPVWEEVQASLLCSLEKEQRGHLIAESVSTDGLLQDEGTQTYGFPSAPFRRDTSLADLTAGKPAELHLQLQVESVTSRHHKASSAFTFLCGHSFQRREYGQHYKNVHSDIQMAVNGWFEQRCPLAYLGCTYSQQRFRPSTHQASVTYNENLGCFTLHPADVIPPSAGGRGAEGGADPLSSLPYEVLCHMASFLDGLSLSQLALVSRLMRQVSSSLLQDRGMVTLRWERRSDPRGGAKWRVKQRVWQFSNSFSPVDAWRFRDAASMSEHLKVCPHYEREARAERVRLPRVRDDVGADAGRRGPTLVGLFQQKGLVT